MTNAATQMAAAGVALRMLLAGDRLAKPDNLLIAASDGVTEPVLDMMMSHALQERSTFLAVFPVDNDAVLLEKIMIVDGSTKKDEINVCNCKFVQKANGNLANRAMNRDEPYEHIFSRGGRRLERRAVSDDSNRAVMQMRGLQAHCHGFNTGMPRRSRSRLDE